MNFGIGFDTSDVVTAHSDVRQKEIHEGVPVKLFSGDKWGLYPQLVIAALQA